MRVAFLRAAKFTAAALVCVLFSSCSGDGLSDVSGTVTVDGNLVDTGSITFIPADGKSQTAGCSIQNGKYSAKVPVGKMSVSITVPKVVGKKKFYNTKDSPEGNLYAESLPERYNKRTTLELDVTSGSAKKDWPLDSK